MSGKTQRPAPDSFSNTAEVNETLDALDAFMSVAERTGVPILGVIAVDDGEGTLAAFTNANYVEDANNYACKFIASTVAACRYPHIAESIFDAMHAEVSRQNDYITEAFDALEVTQEQVHAAIEEMRERQQEAPDDESNRPQYPH